MKALLIIISIQLALGSSSWGENNPPKEAPQSSQIPLEGLFLTPVPEYSGVLDVLNQPDPDEKLTIERQIAQSPLLPLLTQKGKAFKEFYLQRLRDDFRTGTAFVIRPEIETLKRLRVAQPDLVSLKDTLYTEKKASDRALQDTIQNFGLPPSTTIGRLTQDSESDPKAKMALEYFNRKYFQYQNAETVDLTPSLVSPDIFKRKIEDEVLRLRTLNLISFLNKTGSHKIVLEGGRPAKLTNESLAKAEFQWQRLDKPFTGPSEAHQLGLAKSFVSWLGSRKKSKDVDVAREMFVTGERPIELARYALNIKSSAGPFELTEISFHNLMEPMEVFEKLEDLSSETLNVDRYYVEAARRDAMLADFLRFLFEENDHSIETLKTRLQKRLNVLSSLPADAPASLTEEIRTLYSKKYDEGTSLDFIRWGGYAVHPDYWRVRDAVAQNLSRPYFTGPPQDRTQLSKKKQRQERQYEKAAQVRIQSPKTRIRNVVAKGVLYTLLMSALLGTTGALMVAAGGRGGSSHHTSALDKAMETLRKFFNLDGKHGSGIRVNKRGGARSYDPNSDDNDFYNVEAGDQATNDRTPFFVIERIKGEVPRFFVLPHESNLSGDKTYLHEGDGEDADLVLKTLIPSPLWTNGDLPILAPPGYVPIKIEISDDRGIILDRYQHLLLADPKTGVSYARLYVNGGRDANYDYTVYLKKAYDPQESPLFSDLDRNSLKAIGQKVTAAGGLELGAALDHFANTAPDISLSGIEQKFEQTGVYTYDGPTGHSTWFYFGNEFKSHTQFLRQGVYYYQCTGSNNLLFKYLSNYYRGTPEIKVEPVSGFALDPGKWVITAGNGHRETLVTDLRYDFTYKYLDATPVHMDPKYAGWRSHQEQKPADKEKKKRKRKDKIEVDSSPLAPAPGEPKMSEGTDVEEDTHRREQLNQNLLALEQLRTELLSTLKQKSKIFTQIVNSPSTESLVGLRFLPISKIVVEVAQGAIDEKTGLILLLGIRAGLSRKIVQSEPQHTVFSKQAEELLSTHHGFDHALRALLNEEVATLVKRMSQEKASNSPITASKWSYLRDSEIEFRLGKLTTFLTTNDWSLVPEGHSIECGPELSQLKIHAGP